jgi:hypothetical protein
MYSCDCRSIANLEEAIPPLQEKVDNLEFLSLGIQHDISVIMTAMNKLETKLSNLSTSKQVNGIITSFQSSFE